MKRLLLGFFLIAIASAVLLVSDWDQRNRVPRIALLQHLAQGVTGKADGKLAKKWELHLIELNNVLDVEETEQGILKGLAEANLLEGRDYEIKIRNAQGDMATVSGMVDAALGEGADLLITLSTPTLQAALQRSRQGVPIVFTYVSSAIMAGAGRTNEDHLPNVTGVTLVEAFDEMM